MIVYGDPSTQESLQALVARLRESLSAIGPPSLDDLRAVLIQAGMLEQALEDAGAPEAALTARVTDAVAETFVAAWQGAPFPRWARGAGRFGIAETVHPHPTLPQGGGHDPLLRARSESEPSLDVLLGAPDGALTVKTPEGFAFYGLYPEAYAVAADRWRRDHPGASVVVVGVRSIGTALSAVVAVVLGERAYRLAVRPTGHPFAREASLPPLDADWALVVDEGPGLSGSSMAAVAEAAVRAGIARDRVAFLPGHGGEPGTQASAEVRAWWAAAPRVVVGTEELRWDGLSLEETLLRRTEGGVRIEELSGGLWRERVYGDPAEWPGVATAFERRKLRVVRADESAVLWKFVGLMESPSPHPPGAPLRGIPRRTLLSPGGERGSNVLGFAPSPWVEGVALRREDATPGLVARIGRHIEAAAGAPLGDEEARAARGRLEAMLRVNAAEAGLDPHPRPLPLDEPQGGGETSAGDYRLAPWEWRRLPNGEVVKAGRIAPTLDHTVVGSQPLAWDVAGAMVEWGLDDPTGLPPVEDLGFYRAAYAAFRMGQCAMFAGADEEGERLRRDTAFYRAALERALLDKARAA